VKRYKFPLEHALRVRRVQEQLAKADLLGANRRLAEAERTVADQLDRYRSAPEPAAGVPTAAFLTDRARRRAAAATVMAAGIQRQAAAEAAAARMAAWSAAARAVSALERLDGRRRREHAVLAAREDERLVDDVVVSRARRSDSDGRNR
jgi:hypothetical protein